MQLVSPPPSLREVQSSNSSDITSLFQHLVLNTFNTKQWRTDRVKWAQHSPLVSQLNYGHELLTASMVVLPFYLLYLKTSVYKFFCSGSNGTVHWLWTPLMLSAKIILVLFRLCQTKFCFLICLYCDNKRSTTCFIANATFDKGTSFFMILWFRVRRLHVYSFIQDLTLKSDLCLRAVFTWLS